MEERRAPAVLDRYLGRLIRTRRALIHDLTTLREALLEHGIRDKSDYAELLVADALDGQRVASHVNKGYDVVSAEFGRVEVKCRQLPLDGRIEERVEISPSKEHGFDYLAILVFNSNFSIKGAVLIPYGAVWRTVTEQKYRRITFARARQVAEATDITSVIAAAAAR